MSQVVSIKELLAQTEHWMDQNIQLEGWIKTLRTQKQIAFINLSDGSCFTPIQIVLDPEQLDNFSEITKLGTGAALRIRGKVIPSFTGKSACEIQAVEIEVEGLSPEDYPLQPKRHSVEFLRTIAHLRPRTNLFQAVFRVRSEAAFALHEFFHQRNFLYVHTPIITASDCEGAGEMFSISTLDPQHLPLTPDGKVDYKQDFFSAQTSLTVSGQLNAETYAQAFKKVYTFGPTFRAEQSNTARHAAEFWMIEPEIAFAGLQEDMHLATDMLKFVIQKLLERCPQEMEFFNTFVDKGLLGRLEHVVNSEFGCLTYTEAIQILEKADKKFAFPVFWGCDLQSEHERYLTEEYFKKPLFLINYPKEIKSFYMRLNEDQKTVAAMDCLVPGVGELIGGSQREERLDLLEARMRELHMKLEDYYWYLDLRRYGSTKHAGYGLGFERLLMYVTGVNNIRDVIPFPRTPGNALF